MLPGPGTDVLVAGGGVTGPAVARALLRLGATVTVADGKPAARDRVAAEVPGVRVVDLDGHDPSGYDLVVVAPGFRPTAPVVAAAEAAGIEVIGDVELAWRIDRAGAFGTPRDWLVITGTNGKTTTTQMLESILLHAGVRAVACGNIGRPVIDALGDDADPRVLAVELSSFQLHWAPSVRPRAGVVLNVAEDHLDWHGSMAAYTADKARALSGDLAVVGLDDPVASGLQGRVTVGFTTGSRARESTACGPASWSTVPVPRSWPPRACRRPGRRASPTAWRRRPSRRPWACRPCRPARPSPRSGWGAPRRARGAGARDHVHRRLEGHEPARGVELDRGARARGVDRGRPAQGRRRRAVDRTRGRPAHRRGAAGPRRGGDRGGNGATRAGCPRRSGDFERR
ncbi:hypothetical protein MTP03_29900 [Tsukamurella sp. PLM1]|nr:hypothetical protein MTP03_29900 [Tsukamurella sp. PLM1]